jgi:hypothetical protein
MKGLSEDTALLQALARWADTNPAALAKKAGVAVSTINRPYSSTATTRLSRATIDKLRLAFPEFPGWAALDGEVTAIAADPDVVEIDEIDLRYGMGASFLDVPPAPEKRVFSRAWLRGFTRSAPEQLFWAAGDGDSMEPTIRSGEVMLIDTAQKTMSISEGIWAVAIGDVGMIKRLHVPGKGRVQLISDNGRIPPAEVAEDEVHIVGRVIAVVRRL